MVPAFAKIPIKQSSETNPFDAGNRCPCADFALNSAGREALRQQSLSLANSVLAKVGRSLSQACHVAKRTSEANSRFAVAPEGSALGRPSCEKLASAVDPPYIPMEYRDYF
jgi:hypothetical protein